MENKDTNTDYYEVVSVEDQKREILEITIKIIFSFDLRFIFTISYIYREFSSATWKKLPPLKVPISTQNPNLP